MYYRSVPYTDYPAIASSLYNGGWRSEDYDEIKDEYFLDDDETFEICRLLKIIERRENNG